MQARREGVTPVSETFTSKKDAVVWVRRIETRIDAGETNVSAPKATTLADLLNRYIQEVTPAKKVREPEKRWLSRLLGDHISKTLLSKQRVPSLQSFGFEE